MAPVLSILYSVRDAKDQVSTFEINIPTSATIAQATGFAQAIATLVNAVTTGVLTRVGIVVGVTLPGGIRTGATANSDVEEGAKFQFATAGGYRTGFRIPTFLETLIASNSRAVDLEDADVAALVNAIEDGVTITGTLIQPTDGRSDDVTALVSAKEQFLTSRA